MEISYWSDIACPFCYIGASRMKRAMAAVGLNPEDLTMKAYQLNPNAPLETSETLLTEFAAVHGKLKLSLRTWKAWEMKKGFVLIWRGLSQPTPFQLTVLLNGRRSI